MALFMRRESDGSTRVTYHARLPVAWGSKTRLPTSYDFVLPRRVEVKISAPSAPSAEPRVRPPAENGAAARA